jgi:hypothetical protein
VRGYAWVARGRWSKSYVMLCFPAAAPKSIAMEELADAAAAVASSSDEAEATVVHDLCAAERAAAAPEQQPLAVRSEQDGAKVTRSTVLDTVGSTYKGPMSWCEIGLIEGKARQLAHGEGTLTLRNGAVYKGGFVNGLRHGHGEFTTEGGDVYDGEFKEDFAFGQGKLTLGAGGYCEGAWVKGDMHGEGTKVESDGAKVRDRRSNSGPQHVDVALLTSRVRSSARAVRRPL